MSGKQIQMWATIFACLGVAFAGWVGGIIGVFFGAVMVCLSHLWVRKDVIEPVEFACDEWHKAAMAAAGTIFGRGGDV